MPRVNNKYFTLLLVLFLVAGCKSKKTHMEISGVEASHMALVAASPSAVSPCSSLSSNVKFSVDTKGNPLSAKGTMKIKEGEGVQVSMTALGLVEVASIEFFPDNARLIFRLGKEYADIPYSSLDFLQKTGVDYKLLEAVLLNRLFSPDGRPFLQALKEMSFLDTGTSVIATTESYKGVVYSFHLDKATGNLVKTEGVHEKGDTVSCTYADFELVDEILFPHTITLLFNVAGECVELGFVLNRISMKEFEFNARQVPVSYDRRTPEQLLKSVVKK